jgi:hypothetical protein
MRVATEPTTRSGHVSRLFSLSQNSGTLQNNDLQSDESQIGVLQKQGASIFRVEEYAGYSGILLALFFDL